MATTLTPYTALEYAEKIVKHMPLERVYVDIANDIQRRIWHAGNWSWTVAQTSSIAVPASTTGGSQLVEFASLTTPAARFIEGVLKHDIATGGGRTDNIAHLKPVSLNPLTAIVGPPTTFQYIPLSSGGNDGIRFNTKPSFPTDGTFVGLYKTVYPTLTESTLHTTAAATNQQLPDDWYHVYQDGVLWLAMQYAGDGRQGQAQMAADGRISYTGQYGIFMAGLERMKALEPQITLEYRLAQDKVNE